MANLFNTIIDKAIREPLKRFIRADDFLTAESAQALLLGQNGVSYNQPINFAGGVYTSYPTGDNRVLSTIIASIMKDPYIKGMVRIKKNLIFKKGWYVGGGKTTANLYKNVLKNLEIDKFFKQVFYAKEGSGDGILFFTDQGKLKFEPFLAEGFQRVKVVADYVNREVMSYWICNRGQLLYEIPANKVFRIQADADDLDFRFGSGVILSCVKAWLLKQEALSDSQQRFRDGSQANGAFYPDYSFASDSTDMIRDAKDGYNDFRRQVTQNRDNLRGKNVFSPVKLGFQKFTMSNVEMQTLELIRETRKEYSAAIGVPLSAVGDTDGVTYSNAEQGRDNISELIVEPEKPFYEDIAKWVLKNSIPTYDENKNPVVFGTEPTDEELQAYEAKTARVTAQATILQTLQGVMGYKLDLENMEIIEVQATETSEVLSIVENDQKTDQAIESDDKTPTREAPKKPAIPTYTVDNFLQNKTVKKLQTRLETAITKQLDNATA